MTVSEGLIYCLKLYIYSVFAFAIIFYLIHLVIPYDSRIVPRDFEPPGKYIGTFSRGQAYSFVINVLVAPLGLSLGFVLAVFDVSDEICTAVSLVSMLIILYISHKIERRIDEW